MDVLNSLRVALKTGSINAVYIKPQMFRLTHEIAEPIDIDEESCILITETENKENSNEISKNKIDAK